MTQAFGEIRAARGVTSGMAVYGMEASARQGFSRKGQMAPAWCGGADRDVSLPSSFQGSRPAQAHGAKLAICPGRSNERSVLAQQRPGMVARHPPAREIWPRCDAASGREASLRRLVSRRG